jgi:coenzyme F420-dependent glucose-6-phosphate dehydrogenase
MKQGVDDPVELERIADEHLDLAPSRFIVTSDPDEAVERILAYRELGFHHLVFHGPGADQEGFLRRFARDLAPRLRDQVR